MKEISSFIPKDKFVCSVCSRESENCFSIDFPYTIFCSPYCFERHQNILKQKEEIVSEKDFNWWVNALKPQTIDYNQKFALIDKSKVAQWLKPKKSGSKVAHIVAQNSGSSLSLWGDEPLSHEPIFDDEHEPIFEPTEENEEENYD